MSVKKSQASSPSVQEFSLTEKDLARLGKSRVGVHVYLKRMSYKTLYKLAPETRLQVIDRWYSELYAKVVRALPKKSYARLGTEKRPLGLELTLPATEIGKWLKRPEVESVWVATIDGREKNYPEINLRFFTVFARYVIQVENQVTGMQDYEDRMVLILAKNFKDAERKFKQDNAGSDEPYINPDGKLIRWKLERIIDVYDTGADTMTDRLEVFSMISERKLEPGQAWCPQTKKK